MSGRVGSITTAIIEDGLVLNMDAANRASYPKTGTSVENTIIDSTGTMSATGMFDATTGSGVFAFDGVGDYIDFPDNTAYDITDTISVFGWIFVTVSKDASNNQYLLSKQNLYDILVKPSGELVQFYAKNLNTPACTSNSTLDLDTWYYVGATYDKDGGSNNTNIYINGILDSQLTRTNSLGTDSQPVRIGSYTNTGGGGTAAWDLNGNVGPTQIYNRALSASEVLHNYNALKGRFT